MSSFSSDHVPLESLNDMFAAWLQHHITWHVVCSSDGE